MSNVAVRKAIASIIDRNKLVDDVYHSTAEPLYSLIPRGLTSHSTPFFDDYPQPDVAEARKLLTDAGIHTPVTFSLLHASGGSWAPEAAELRAQLEASGLFKVNVIEKEWGDFQKTFGSGEFDAYTIGWINDYPDPDNFVQPLIGKDSSMQSGYLNDKVQELITTTQQYSKRALAADSFKTLQEIAADDVPILPLWQKKDYVLSREDVNGAQWLSDGTGIWRLWELVRI